jgi:hypothetical protein
MIQQSPELEVLLPTTAKDLDSFVASLIEEFGLPEGDDTYDMVATQILHLPLTRARAPRSYFANGVLKSMANKAAFEKLQEFKQKRDRAEQDRKNSELKLVQSEQAPAGVEPIQNA